MYPHMRKDITLHIMKIWKNLNNHYNEFVSSMHVPNNVNILQELIITNEVIFGSIKKYIMCLCE